MEDAPPFFLCPISMEIMKDPVTISSGMTFERESIQKWLLHYKKKVCPVTMLPLLDVRLTPNLNLRRLILSWHSQINASFASLSPEDDAIRRETLLGELQQPTVHVNSLRAVRSVLREGDASRRRDDELFSVVACLVSEKTRQADDADALLFLNEGLSVLCMLEPSTEMIESVSAEGSSLFVASLCSIITNHPALHARILAVFLLQPMLAKPSSAGLSGEFFQSMTEILKDQNSAQGSAAVLHVLVQIISAGKNTENAVNGGIVPVLVELVAEGTKNRKFCEMMLVVLEKMCRKAEGREAFVAHAVGLAAVLSTILRVSQLGNDKAVSLLTLLFRFCKRNDVASQFIEVGGAAKLWALLQCGCRRKTKQKATEILLIHLSRWMDSPCYPSGFRSWYSAQR